MGVSGLLTLELAVSGTCDISAQFCLDCCVGLMILGDTMIFFCRTMKHASLPCLLQ